MSFQNNSIKPPSAFERNPNPDKQSFAPFEPASTTSAKANSEQANDSTSSAATEKNSPSPPRPRPRPRPRLPDTVCRYFSKLDTTRGPLRTTSDGNLIDEATGDWLVLDTPPHDREDRVMALQQGKKNAKKKPEVGLPEAKNGATGLEDPRAGLSVTGYVRKRLFAPLDRGAVGRT